jgi:hypothetical protein
MTETLIMGFLKSLISLLIVKKEGDPLGNETSSPTWCGEVWATSLLLEV